MQNSDDKSSGKVIHIDFAKRSTSHKTAGVSDSQAKLDQEKYDLCARWLDEGIVCVLFDARPDGVKVPEAFKNRGDLRLNFSYAFLTPDFNYNGKGIWGTMLFPDGPFFCMVPWQFVYGIQSAKLKRDAVWLDSFPKDYAEKPGNTLFDLT
ncbi:MAG TPA: hypothetical protein VEL47_03755 [Myxococcota bacterium]|nr:hypothetical protein [Myxococcota bacterium]